MIYQLLYTSRSLAPRGHDSDLDILSVALGNNRLLGITGCLLREEGGFCQVIEGTRRAVRELFEQIKRDPRHFAVTERINRVVPARSFQSWSMCYGTLEPEDRAFLSRRRAGEDRNLALVIDRVHEIAIAS